MPLHISFLLSNAICPSNGADLKGPTAVTNSVGVVLGGKTENGEYINYLPNGSSHTITFNPTILNQFLISVFLGEPYLVPYC